MNRVITFAILIMSLLSAMAPAGNVASAQSIPTPQPCWRTGEAAEPITINIYYMGENGAARAFAEEMKSSGLLDQIRAEDGVISYDYFFPMDDPETVVLIDVWSDQQAIDDHHDSPVMAQISALRDKYNLHMRVERYVSAPTPKSDEKYIRK